MMRNTRTDSLKHFDMRFNYAEAKRHRFEARQPSMRWRLPFPCRSTVLPHGDERDPAPLDEAFRMSAATFEIFQTFFELRLVGRVLEGQAGSCRFVAAGTA